MNASRVPAAGPPREHVKRKYRLFYGIMESYWCNPGIWRIMQLVLNHYFRCDSCHLHVAYLGYQGHGPDALGFASSTYTLSPAIAYWTFIKPITSNFSAIILVYSFIVSVLLNGYRRLRTDHRVGFLPARYAPSRQVRRHWCRRIWHPPPPLLHFQGTCL